jgi:PhoH-like ATPase
MAQKNFVIDTNVLLENPHCLKTFRNGNENRIVLPYTVLQELDKLKKDNRISHLVAQTIKEIESDRHIMFLSPNMRACKAETNDDKIIAEIVHSKLQAPILVTNDRIMQIKARLHNIVSAYYRDSHPFQSESQAYTGFIQDKDAPVSNCFRWESGAPVFLGAEGTKPVDYQHKVWNVQPRNIYQNLAFELMLNPDIHLTSIQSEAGYGKTFLSLASALHLIMEAKDTPYTKIYVVKPIIEIGSRMGFLPGDAEEKMVPYIRYILDLLLKLHELRPANRIFDDQEKNRYKLNPKRFQVLPLAYIRGMNIEDAVVIIDEMQNLSRSESRSLLTRMGKGVKCFCLGDTRQVDNLYLNESNNGLNWLVKKCKGMKNYAHIVLKGDTSRGPITDMVLQAGL